MECKNDMLDTLPYNANWLVCNSYEHTQVHCLSVVVKHFFPESTKTKDFPLFSFGGSAIAHTHHHSTESLLQDRCVLFHKENVDRDGVSVTQTLITTAFEMLSRKHTTFIQLMWEQHYHYYYYY